MMDFIYLGLSILVLLFFGGTLKVALTKLIGALIPLTSALEAYSEDVEQEAIARREKNSLKRNLDYKKEVSALKQQLNAAGIDTNDINDEFNFPSK